MLYPMVGVDFLEIQLPVHRIAIRRGFAFKFLKSGWLAHVLLCFQFVRFCYLPVCSRVLAYAAVAARSANTRL